MGSTPEGNTYLATMISLASSAFGMAAALAWNQAITEVFRLVLPEASRVFGHIVEAIVITVIAVFVMVMLGKAAHRIGGTPVRPVK